MEPADGLDTASPINKTADPLPIRMLNEHLYCPRLFYLMHVEGYWQTSGDTIEGSMQHGRTHKRQKSRAPETEGEQEWPAPPRQIELASPADGIIGKLDVLEQDSNTDGSKVWIPIEYKHSAAPPAEREFFSPSGKPMQPQAWPNDQVQLAAQALLLKACGYHCEYGFFYYRQSGRRVRIEFSEELLEITREEIAAARATENGPLPPPLLDSPKCQRCSLNSICLPWETNLLLGNKPSSSPSSVLPSRDDLGVLYVSEPGKRVGRSSENIVISDKDVEKEPVRIPFKDVSHATVTPYVQLSSQLIAAFLESGRSISWITVGGRYLGAAFPPLVKNFHLRKAQYSLLDDSAERIRLARTIVFTKIMNGRTLLRRNGGQLESLQKLRGLMHRAKKGSSLAEILGIEGFAAREYFNAWGALIAAKSGFQWTGRSRRPPRDPLNAMLSFGYSLLTRDMEIAIRNAGLDPLAGFYHAIEGKRPALALDLMEPFRSIVIDSVILRAASSGAIKPDDFVILPMHASMKPGARKRFLEAYEQRMHETIRHPRFSYSISYRRVLELEARLFARRLEGELHDYVPLMTR